MDRRIVIANNRLISTDEQHYIEVTAIDFNVSTVEIRDNHFTEE